jgi:hypothetical protein
MIGRYDPATNSLDAVIGIGQTTLHALLYNPNDKSIIVTSRGSTRFPLSMPR